MQTVPHRKVLIMNATDNASKFRRALRVLDIAREMAHKVDKATGTYSTSNHMEKIQLYNQGYAEPGYDGDLVAVGNWNNVDRYDSVEKKRVEVSNFPERVGKILEKLGFETEWSDEWTSCHDCGKLVRTSPDSYSWTPSYAIVNECELLCHECIADDPTSYLEDHEDNPNTAITIDDIDPADYGYTKINEDRYEAGWRSGQTDDPKEIAKALAEEGWTRIIFKITGQGQFDTKFDVYGIMKEWRRRRFN